MRIGKILIIKLTSFVLRVFNQGITFRFALKNHISFYQGITFRFAGFRTRFLVALYFSDSSSAE